MAASFFTIGIIGTGKMAAKLGELWAARGHRVCFGSREPAKARELAAGLGANVQGGSQAEAFAFGDVVALAVPWSGARETVTALGPWQDKILIDMTNAIRPSAGGMQLALDSATSAAEQIAAWAPGARVVKAYNSIHFRNLDRPDYDGVRASAFYCGDDPEARAVVARLSQDLGFEPVDAGPLANARLLEALAVLWMQLAFSGSHGPEVAFKLLKR